MENYLLNLLTKDERKYVKGISVKKNSTIFKEGDKCDCIGIVFSGQVKICSYSFSGNEMLFATINANEVFGNNLLFSSDNSYKGNVIATEKTVLALIHKKNLLTILKSNETFLKAYLEIQSDGAKELNNKIRMLSYDSAEERLIYYIYSHGGKVEFKSVTELANVVHLKRETVSRLLTKLNNDKVIERSKNKIIYKY